jgi:hypothetical protein
MPGVRWSEPHRKWKVVLRVRGEDHYYGLFDDLEEAKSVCARARLDHDYERPRSDREPDTTAHLADAELLERFALDDDGDPVWREKAIVGDEATMRDNARWNSRHAGAKLGERAGFERDGKVKLMYRTDIAARLARLMEASDSESLGEVDFSESTGNRGVSSGDMQTSRIPRDENEATKHDFVPESDYDQTIADVLALINDPKAREAAAKALEAKVVSLAPVGKGPLARMLMETKREFGLRQDELIVLSSGKDPYGQDTPEGHKIGRWLKVRLDLHAPDRRIHLRGVHYLLVAVQAMKPDGTPYQNNKDDYFWLNDRAAKAARWLRYIDFERISDERNAEPVIFRAERRSSAPIGVAIAITGYQAPSIIRPAPVIEISRASPRAVLTGFHVEQRFCFATFGEKSSLSEVLTPFCSAHNMDGFIAIGELSETRAYQMARDAVEDGRKLICFTFSDFDPSGFQMPVSIAVKLMAQRNLQFPELEFAVVSVALTLEQVIENRLPTAMVDKNDKRRDRWQAIFAPPLIEAGLLPQEEVDRGGLAQVEIDALAALRPDVLRRYADEAIAPFLDATLQTRAAEAQMEWERAANETLATGVDRAKLDMLSHAERIAANRFNSLVTSRFNSLTRVVARSKERLDALENAIDEEVRRVALPPAPKTPEAKEKSETAVPLVDSDWGYYGMVEALKARKKYEDEG